MSTARTTSDRIAVDHDRLAAFCRWHHIRALSLFGSVLRDDFWPDSDVDVLVEFEPGHPVGYIRLAGMERRRAPTGARTGNATAGGVAASTKADRPAAG